MGASCADGGIVPPTAAQYVQAWDKYACADIKQIAMLVQSP